MLVMLVATLLANVPSFGFAPSFVPPIHSNRVGPLTVLSSDRGRRPGYSTRNNAGKERSKRQERVGQLVQTELSRIIHTGNIKVGGNADGAFLDDTIRKAISIVKVDVSPDLRQARISVSIRSPKSSTDVDGTIGKRRAYSWLVQNTKHLRHTLAQRMSHMKSSAPNLTFVQVDVSAAVDVMYLIDKLSKDKDYKRATDEHDLIPSGIVGGVDFDDEDFDDEDFEEDDDDEDFF